MKKIAVFTFFLLIVICSERAAIADVPGCDINVDDCGDIDGPNTPLDGGVLILLAAGAAYGYTKLKDKKVGNAD